MRTLKRWLVLDNCEHLDEAAGLADLLMERAPELRILTTSREALGVDGEHNWQVPSLATATDESESVPPAAALFFSCANLGRANARANSPALNENTANQSAAVLGCM